MYYGAALGLFNNININRELFKIVPNQRHQHNIEIQLQNVLQSFL